MSDKNGNGQSQKSGTSDHKGAEKSNANDNKNADATEAHVMGRGRGRGLVDEYGERIVTTDSESGHDKPSGSEQETKIASRGKERDGRQITEILTTKPTHVATKQGKEGQQISLLTNHFKINFNPLFKVSHYRVDFVPETEELKVRRQILAHIQEQLGAFIYDGQNILYLTHHMPSTEIVSQARDGTPYRVLLKDTKTTVELTEAMGLMVS